MQRWPAVLVTASLIVGAALLVHTALAFAEQGQGPVEGDNVRIEDMRLGEYWYGAEISQEDLVGKVVLVEMWGS